MAHRVSSYTSLCLMLQDIVSDSVANESDTVVNFGLRSFNQRLIMLVVVIIVMKFL